MTERDKIKERRLSMKGWIAASISALTVLSYIIYYLSYNNGIKLDELYFISTGIAISVLTGLLFTLFDNKIIRALNLFASVFYGILISVYSIHWIITGLPYAYIKISLIAGFISGLIYLTYDVLSSNTNIKN